VPGWSPGPRPSSSPAGLRSAPVPWAGAVALAPLAGLGVAAAAALLAGPDVGVWLSLLVGAVAAVVFAVVAALKDIRDLTAAGEPVSRGLAWWCLLAPWAYLWARAVKRASTSTADRGLLAAAVAVWLLVIVICVPVARAATTPGAIFNRAKVQSDIAAGIKAKTGYAVTVDCPQHPPLDPGSKFQCTATTAGGSTFMVDITIQDRSGDYSWQVGG
jgi:Domain of unknown function (DUF4333)